MGNMVVNGTDGAICSTYPTMSYGYGYGFNGYSHQNNDACEVIQAVHNGSLHNLNATKNAEGNIISDVSNSTLHTANLMSVEGNNTRQNTTQHGLRNNDAIQGVAKSISDSESRLTSGLAEITNQIGDTKHDLCEEICEVSKDSFQQFALTREQNTNNSWKLSNKINDVEKSNIIVESKTRDLINGNHYQITRDIDNKFADINARIDDKFCAVKELIREVGYKAEIHAQAQHNQIIQVQKDAQLADANARIHELEHRNNCQRDDNFKVQITNINNVVGNLSSIVQDLIIKNKS